MIYGMRVVFIKQLRAAVDLPALSRLVMHCMDRQGMNKLCFSASCYLQVTACFLAGHLVDCKGQDVYMQYPERLSLPITFITGVLSGCIHPPVVWITEWVQLCAPHNKLWQCTTPAILQRDALVL